jgi:hypothetical protein
LSEVIWYPQLASFVSRTILKQGDAGSAILFYRDVYVLPAGVVLGIAVAVAAIAMWRRRRHLSMVLWGALAVDLILVCFSVWLYLTTVAAAERYRGI